MRSGFNERMAKDKEKIAARSRLLLLDRTVSVGVAGLGLALARKWIRGKQPKGGEGEKKRAKDVHVSGSYVAVGPRFGGWWVADETG